jgi:hypothetical protein
MIRLNQFAIFGAVVALVFVANVSHAVPLSQGANSMIEAEATLNLVEYAHGTHRTCRRGWVRRGGAVRWHRHVGVAHRPVRC